MTISVLLFVVAFQVLVFQFLGARLGRLLPDYLVGVRDLPPETAAAIARHRDHLGRGRRWIGGALLLLLALTALGAGGHDGRKLVVTGASLVSTLVFLAGYARDRRFARRLAASVPSPGARSASLERPTLSRLYPIGWELVPVVVWIATLALAAVAMREGGTGLLGLVALQSGVVIGGFLFALWYARSGPRLTQRARAHLGDAETALRVDRRVRALELRALLTARIGFVLLVAAKQAGRVLPLLGVEATALLDVVEWALVAGLLAVFALYVTRLGRNPAPGAGPPDAHG